MKKIMIPIFLGAVAFMTVSATEELVKTQLKVTVLDDLGNIQKGAAVRDPYAAF